MERPPRPAIQLYSVRESTDSLPDVIRRVADAGFEGVEFATRLAANLEKLIQDEGPDTVAAFIAEPVMGAGGVLVPPATYFDKIQAVLKKYDVLMIADEVICGFGRTGNMWGSETFNIQPDILTCAKALSSSYLPISAVLVSDAVYDGIAEGTNDGGPPFGHGYTYGGHPVSAAVAVETLKIYDEIDMVGHVQNIGPKMQAGLRQFQDHPLVGEVRGIGLVAAVEVVEDKASKKAFDPARKVGQFLADRAQDNGMIVRAMNDSIGFTPPLIMKEAEINEMVEKMGKSLDETWAAVQAGEI